MHVLLIIAMAHAQFLFYIFCISWTESYPSKCLVTQLIWHAKSRYSGVNILSDLVMLPFFIIANQS
ncbi:hypothetical protein GLOIN_2v1732026, partial [Rhizophagus irregularis DAOM 181602=DAOM 197198]